jgi:hypothetical protein
VLQGLFGTSEQRLPSTATGRVHAVLWLEAALVWATDAGVYAAQAGALSRSAALPRPSDGGEHSCELTAVTGSALLATWPHAVQLLQVSAKGASTTVALGASLGTSDLRRRLGAAPGVTLQAVQTISVGYRLLRAAPFGPAVLVLADCREAACRPDSGGRHADTAKGIDANGAASDSATDVGASDPDSARTLGPAPGQASAIQDGQQRGDNHHGASGSFDAGALQHDAAAQDVADAASGQPNGQRHDRQQPDDAAQQPAEAAAAPDSRAHPDDSEDKIADDAGTFAFSDRLQLRVLTSSGAELQHDELDVPAAGMIQEFQGPRHQHQHVSLPVWTPPAQHKLATAHAVQTVL